MEGKIIGVGFQKTGTSTLRDALRILGFSVKDTTPRALIPILRGNYKRVVRILSKYDALEDTPWYMIYKELDALFPGSRFILTIRDEESWYRSVSNHIGDLPAAQHEWIYGRGKGLPKDHKENTISVYSEHIKGVYEYFKDRPGDLLTLDFTKGDKWEKLCAFLGKEVPETEFPHSNKTADSKEKADSASERLRIMRHRIKNSLKIYIISLMKWWPE